MSQPISDEKNVPDISAIIEKVLADIQNLQQLEQEQFNKIEKNPSLSAQEQQEIIEQINKLSTMRTNLYTTLSEINAFYKNALTSSTGTLKEQTSAINIVETELNRSKKRLEYLEMQRNNKIRLVEINQYYGDKYVEHTTLMKVVIFTLIPIIILTILFNKGFLPSRIYYILFIIVGVVGAYYFWNTYASIITRDNMNYQTYDWPFDPNSAPKGSGDDVNDPWVSSGRIGGCIGEACCSVGQIYSPEIDQCIGNSTFVPPDSGSSSNSGSSTLKDCKVNGNHAYDKNCENAQTLSSCSSGCGTRVPGLGNVCCSSSCCPNRKRESFVTRKLAPATYTMNEVEIHNALTKTQPGKYKADVNLAPLRSYNGF